MKKVALICIIFSTILMVSCEQSSTPDPDTQTVSSILVQNAWKVERITDANGNVLNTTNLPNEAQALFGINIQFFNDKTVKAIDPIARMVLNAGTWALLDQDKTLDIDIKDLKGKFPINKFERTRMILGYQVLFNGVNFNVNLELVPAV